MNLVKKLIGLYMSRPIGATIIIVPVLLLSLVGGAGVYLEYDLKLVSKAVAYITGKDVSDISESNESIASDFESAKNGSSNKGKDSKQSATTNDKKTSGSAAKGTKPSTKTTKPSSGATSPQQGSQTTTSPPVSTANDKFGMSAPTDKWNERLAQVGPSHIKYRRIFLQSFTDNLSKVSEALNAGMTPVISWKTGSYSWSQVASGAADGQLYNLVAQLNAIPGPKILVVHHEPAGDGTYQDYTAMQLHALPILKTANQASVGIIGNGWWWSALNQGYTDAEIAQWIPQSLKNVCDFIAADTYQDSGLNEDGGVKAARMAAWARRTGGVQALGIGEFNGFTASSITNVMNVVKADSLFKWALVWNSGPSGLGTPLEGDRLQAFINGKATPNQT